MSGEIIVKNQSKRTAEIRIEGIIGLPEKAQFDDPKERIATYEAFQNAIRNIQDIKARTVIVNIRSTGGNVNDALLICDALAGLGAEIVTRCYGYTASAATVIAQAASKGKREISQNALYLIHRASSSAEGNAGELTQTADLLGKTDERIAALYAAASGRDAGNFTALMNENNGNGRWLSPEEAVEKGLADRVIPTGRIKNTIRGLLGIEAEIPLPPPPVILSEAEGSPAKGSKNAAEELEAEIARYENPVGNDAGQEITDLQNRIAELEALNAKLRAKATPTLPKEDPSTREIRREGNATAYENDLQQFKNL